MMAKIQRESKERGRSFCLLVLSKIHSIIHLNANANSLDNVFMIDAVTTACKSAKLLNCSYALSLSKHLKSHHVPITPLLGHLG